ncbi:SPW repeat protein [Halosolutus gelatinilyticus]|uniref:SPW repeat protein n=1 Tax=Halosolutus gelatinilyticus TaxID=2931975 RepID=UPI001FF3F39F|nr:SPW repeat protein [Halosolutus gelatinilyticus]
MHDERRDASEHDPDAEHDKRGDRRAVTHRDRIEYEPNPERRGRRLSTIVGLLGVWLIASTIWLDPSPSAFWNAVLVGLGLATVGAYNDYRRSKRELGSAGVAAFGAILGLWLVASPFLVGPAEGTAAQSGLRLWNEVLVGLLAFGVGTYGAFAIRSRRKAADARPTATYDRSGQ